MIQAEWKGVISCSPMADVPPQLQKWERRLAHLVGIYCKKKRDGGRGGKERERERGRRCGHKSMERI